MRTAARTAFRVFAAVSLFLTILASAVCVRSYFRSDAVVYSSAHALTAIQWARGHLGIGRFKGVEEPRRGLWLDSWPASSSMTLGFSNGSWYRWGFGVDRSKQPGGATADRIILPLWSVIAVAAVTPMLIAPRFLRQRHRRRHGRCLACGYDLRASTERCPECGSAPVTRMPSVDSR